MPYIKDEDRAQYDPLVAALAQQLRIANDDQMDRAGHTNYVITTLLLEAFPTRKYATMALVDGILSNIGREYYRRRVAPYEDEKILENGDVYDTSGG
ncbi:hypothetical protein LCGC14_1392720 [marine sediment metagenome]|uniref:Uncharacterized protein n=1 Tax=marine sediment metagenome TaxID=412755 RepID=A0A0F9KK87_9ZZZZ